MSVRNLKQIAVLGLLVFVFGSSPKDILAQSKDTIPTKQAIPELPGDEVEVIKNFKARLAETQRMRIIPEVPIHWQEPLDYNYEVNVRGLSLDYLPPVIRPLAMKSDPPAANYNTDLKFGYGYPHFSVASVNSAYTLMDNLVLGVNYDHQAARNDQKIVPQYCEHVGKVYADYELSEILSIRADFDVDIDRHALVGVDSISNLNQDTRMFQGGLILRPAKNAELNYDYDAHISFSNKGLVTLDQSENWFRTGVGATYDLGKVSFGGVVDYDRIAYDGDTLDALNSLQLIPSAQYGQSSWNLDVGFNFLFENGKVNYLPKINAQFKILESKLIANVFADSDTKFNSWHQSTEYNPYLSQILNNRNQKTIKLGLGASGQVNTLTYQIQGGYKIGRDIQFFELEETSLVDDVYMYVANSTSANSPFVEWSAKYGINKLISVELEGYYQNYTDSTGTSLNGINDVFLQMGIPVSFLEDKLTIKPEARWIGNIAREVELDHSGFFDIGLDANYEIGERFGVFADVRNLLSSDNERWANYPSLGIQVAGGVHVKF